jgi:hypothetical protein
MDRSENAWWETWHAAGDKDHPGGSPIGEALSIARPIVDYKSTVWRIETTDLTPSTSMEASRWTLRRTYRLRYVSHGASGLTGHKGTTERLQGAVEQLETRFTVPAGLDADQQTELQRIAAKNCIYGLISQAGPLIDAALKPATTG